MLISESLEERVPEGRGVERVILLGPDDGASYLSTVIVRIPPRHEFPLHTHPRSEDCFFVLAGSGEVFSPDVVLTVAAHAAVWIPAGVPHGLRAGGEGMLEVGFQAPPDPTAVPFAPPARELETAPLQMESLATELDGADEDEPWWTPTFPRRRECRYLDVHDSLLKASQELPVAAGGGELIVVVARGAVALAGGDRDRTVKPMAMLRLSGAEAITLRALETPTLLHAVRALAADPPASVD